MLTSCAKGLHRCVDMHLLFIAIVSENPSLPSTRALLAGPLISSEEKQREVMDH